MRDFNALERGWEAAKWRGYEADINQPEHIPTLIERRQAAMRLVGKSRGWSDLEIDVALSELSSGNSFAGAIGYDADRLPPPASKYYPLKKGWGLWNLRHRKEQ